MKRVELTTAEPSSMVVEEGRSTDVDGKPRGTDVRTKKCDQSPWEISSRVEWV